MNGKNNSEKETSNSYFKYLIFVLMLVQIVDSYSTVFPGSIPSLIANEFLGAYSTDVQNSIMAFASGLVSIGMYFLFISQYLADKIGRKKMLAITIFGMAFATLGMFFSPNYIVYMFFVFLLYFFFSSDIWLIYINEEAKPNKRALYSNIILMAGLVGPFVMVISRFIFITETSPNWRGMTLFPAILGFSLCVIILLTLKETSRYKLMKKDTAIKRSFKEDLISIFKTENRKPYTILLIMSFLGGISGIYMGLFEKYIADVGTLTQGQVTIIFLTTVFMVLIAYALNGFLADRIGRKPLLYLWTCLAPISVILWVFGATVPQLAFIIVLLGFSLSHISFWGLLGINRLIAIELLPTDRRGTGIGFRSLIGSIGGTTGLFLSSLVILFLGLGTTFILFVLVKLLVIPLAYMYIKETKGIELSEIK
jgi:MFS family permease